MTKIFHISKTLCLKNELKEFCTEYDVLFQTLTKKCKNIKMYVTKIKRGILIED